ncbi:pyridoxal phosphate-dependent transferase [Leucosporidium creatinivorum]|uniref:Pyridoxal phosphate-dependent transferase n=1 Tax=Leucosporidium creatinivorum TaxID=106004 RepID=A0A1Y2F1C6_9BASI|nr:pyridoxal phosphate-dependent transferase [Leucosporidium creatinivorum]
MTSLDVRLTKILESRAKRQILRSLTPTQPTGQPVVDFSSNDYLSLARSPVLRTKVLAALKALPSPYGPPSSRLLDGNSSHHLALEAQLAAFFCAETGLLFNSGFDANVGAWTVLPDEEDWIVYDELIHASVHDGMRAARVEKGKRRSFKHNDVEDLQRVLKDILRADSGVKTGERSVWVGVETLYSMDGDLSPLKEIVELVESMLPKGNGHMVVDEAHSTGLYGNQGRGVVCALGLANRITVRVHTFGKAMACSGAVVLCSPLIRSYLINYARPLIYSTAMPHMNVIAIKTAFDMLEEGHGDAVAAHVHYLSTLLLQLLSAFLSPTSSPVSLPPTLALTTAPSPAATTAALTPNASPSLQPMLLTSPIIPLITASPRPLSRFLGEKGFLVRPITYPTVPKGQERVRVCLHAGNTEDEVRRLSEVVSEWVRDEGKREAAEAREKELRAKL